MAIARRFCNVRALPAAELTPHQWEQLLMPQGISHPGPERVPPLMHQGNSTRFPLSGFRNQARPRYHRSFLSRGLRMLSPKGDA